MAPGCGQRSLSRADGADNAVPVRRAAGRTVLRTAHSALWEGTAGASGHASDQWMRRQGRRTGPGHRLPSATA
jgi:hypothetical protein